MYTHLQGNTVGSLKALKLKQRQENILIGKVLGDACIEKNGRHSRVKIDQGARQRDYVLWLYNEFEEFATKEPYFIEVMSRYKRVGHYRFATYSLPVFDYYRELFYQNGRKTIPKLISNYLFHPLSLAIWYMDDGYRRTDRSGIYLCTSAFDQKEHKLLGNCLVDNFGLDSNVHYAGGYARIHIPSRSARKFCDLVRPYIIPSFGYKLL